MSRANTQNGGTQSKKTEDDGELNSHFGNLTVEPDSPPFSQVSVTTHSLNAVPDICPVCKSSRYLNQNMRFLVNPECYHKMCESCVDRIFSSGPAPCPVAGCARTLRKQRFRKQTFGDIQVEREVDIRRRVAAV